MTTTMADYTPIGVIRDELRVETVEATANDDHAEGFDSWRLGVARHDLIEVEPDHPADGCCFCGPDPWQVAQPFLVRTGDRPPFRWAGAA